MKFYKNKIIRCACFESAIKRHLTKKFFAFPVAFAIKSVYDSILDAKLIDKLEKLFS
jgi:hypothetical protein